MAKYNTYIELSPHYESVVDIDSESRHPDMWQEYIVHEDMKGAIEKICDSMKYEDEDKRRSFWIHGAYGTGKSYAVKVISNMLRSGAEPSAIVDECLAVPAKPDKRDLTAIKRLCTAFVKLLYPNATCKDDISADEFIKYCLEPAKEMRGVIKRQLCIIDPKEFNVPGKKDIPDIQYNYL